MGWVNPRVGLGVGQVYQKYYIFYGIYVKSTKTYFSFMTY